MKNEKPIIFSGDMVRAIQNTKINTWPAEPIDPEKPFKSMTRRVVPQRILEKRADYEADVACIASPSLGNCSEPERDFYMRYCRFQPPNEYYEYEGDLLWVRETFCKYIPEHIIDGKEYSYKANASPISEEVRRQYVTLDYPYKWKSPLYMPRVASRFLLEVKSVKVQRIRDITYEDCKAEGLFCDPPQDERLYPMGFIKCYRDLWNDLNEKRGYGWDKNPWVYVYEFMRLI
jgi:hypothetical protein